jgi:hypothetical protein
MVVNATAQYRIEGVLRDSIQGRPVAFAAITVDGAHGRGILSDIDGRFRLDVAALPVHLNIRILGYAPRGVWISDLNPEVLLSPQNQTLSEVHIRAGDNPAFRILRETQKRSKSHDVYAYPSWTCQTYDKMILSGRPDTAWKATDTESLQDKQSADSLFGLQHLLLIESHSTRKYLDGKEKEVVDAARVSGLSDPSILLMALRFQPFSAYSTMLSLGGIDYLNPLSRNSESRYRFVLGDTLFEGTDTLYTLHFEPLKGTYFKGLRGSMQVSAPDYALRSFSAETLNDDGGPGGLRIRQQYHRLPNGRWFTEQLHTWLDLSTVKLSGYTVGGEVKSYVHSVDMAPQLRPRDFDDIVVDVLPLASKCPESRWDTLRVVPLDARERNTYKTIDSLGKVHRFDYRMKSLEALSRGSVAWKGLDFDLSYVLRYNSYEGIRTGLGIFNNDRISRHFRAGGYLGYGWSDRAWKYGTSLQWNVSRRGEVWLRVSWSDDVYESAGPAWMQSRWLNAQEQTRQLLVRKMDREERSRIELHHRFRKFDLRWFGGTTHLRPRFEYRFNGLPEAYRFSWNEAGLHLVWSPRAESFRSGNLRVAMQRAFPEVRYLFRMGKGLNSGSGSYRSSELEVDVRKHWRRLGTSFLRMQAGRVEGAVPYGRLFAARANYHAGDKLPLMAGNALETLEMNGMVSNQYIAAYLLHDLGSFFRVKAFQPRFALAANGLVGRLSNAWMHQGISMQSPDLGYFEAGLLVNNLLMLQSSATGYGIGGFYRFGAYADASWKKNLVFKISLSLPI